MILLIYNFFSLDVGILNKDDDPQFSYNCAVLLKVDYLALYQKASS